MEEKKIPLKKISAGNIKATIWNNEKLDGNGESRNYKIVTVEKIYKDKTGNWQSTNSFYEKEIQRAILVLQEAYKTILLKETEQEIKPPVSNSNYAIQNGKKTPIEAIMHE